MRKVVLASAVVVVVALAWWLFIGPPRPGYVAVGRVSTLLLHPRTLVVDGHPVIVANGDDPNLYASSARGPCYWYQVRLWHGTAYIDRHPHPCVHHIIVPGAPPAGGISPRNPRNPPSSPSG
jgi:hypothetical protein